jgi:hypothetical protein
MTIPSNSLRRVAHCVLLAGAFVLCGLHFQHLAADFPNHSPWMDWAKYTDEGWYGDAAIRFFQWGHWNVPGDFNPAAALPVWPFLEGVVFLATGVSIVAARALSVSVFLGSLLAAWLLVQRTRPSAWQRRTEAAPALSLAGSVGVLLLAASPFCFVFSRLAILEPLLVLFTLLALLAASAVRPLAGGVSLGNWSSLRALLGMNLVPVLLLGCLLPTIILTKTTGMFLLPAIAWMLFAAAGFSPRAWLALGTAAALLAAMLWLGYFLVLIRPRFYADYHYLFAANAYTGITRTTALKVIGDSIRGGFWIGPVIYPLALAAAVVAVLFRRRIVRQPLIPALILWAGGYLAFLAYHSNMQPRYYFVIAVPVMLLPGLVFEQLLLPGFKLPAERFAGVAILGVLLVAVAAWDVAETVKFVAHPEYTLLHAADDVRQYIQADERSDPHHNPLILSISGSDISLMTGLHSICDDFGTLELVDRVRLYKPGWYVAWNAIEDDKMEALEPFYHVVRVATFPAMDDPDRNLLILYKLIDATGSPVKPIQRPPIPKRLRTKMGQQPSVEQLEH